MMMLKFVQTGCCIFHRLSSDNGLMKLGPGQWALILHGITKIGGNGGDTTVCYDGSLFIRGHYVARAVGESTYRPNNPMVSYATAAEASKSDCITRCVKDLGIAAEMWMPAKRRLWIKKYAVRVFRTGLKSGKGGVAWRRADAEPFEDESMYQLLSNELDQVASLDGLEMWMNDNATAMVKVQERQLHTLRGKYTKIKERLEKEKADATGVAEQKPEDNEKKSAPTGGANS